MTPIRLIVFLGASTVALSAACFGLVCLLAWQEVAYRQGLADLARMRADIRGERPVEPGGWAVWFDSVAPYETPIPGPCAEDGCRDDGLTEWAVSARRLGRYGGRWVYRTGRAFPRRLALADDKDGAPLWSPEAMRAAARDRVER